MFWNYPVRLPYRGTCQVYSKTATESSLQCDSTVWTKLRTKIEQQLEEIRQEIRVLRENKTTGSGNGKGL